MDLIDHEQRCPAAGGYLVACLLQYFADVLDAAGDGAELPEAAVGLVGQQPCEGCLPNAGRTVEDDGAEPPRSQQSPEQLSLAKKVLLADKLGKRCWAHARGEGLHVLQVVGFALSKQVVHRGWTGSDMVEQDRTEAILFTLFLLGIVSVIVAVPLMWTVVRILRPVDKAARERNLPFRFSMGDFLCLFWIVQLPLTFVFRLSGDQRDDSAEMNQFYWILTGAVWLVAPLAWMTVARALSKAGVAAGMHRMIFLAVVLPTVYYGLFPFIAMSIAVMVGLMDKGARYFAENKSMSSLWILLGVSIIACGYYSPWMVRQVGYEVDRRAELDDEDESGE